MLFHPLIARCLVCASLFAGGWAVTPPAAAEGFDLRQAVAVARRADLRVFEGQHLVLVTDRPSGSKDDLASLPALFDEAFDSWCDHFHFDPTDYAEWQAFGCLVVEPERFRSCGLLPPAIPAFENGFCAGSRFWLMDQSNPAYRRHLLLHEGVHAFTLTLRDLNTPAWYTEGIAELLATHRLSEGRFIATPVPLDADDVEQLGRIEAIRALRENAAAPSLTEVFETPPSEHHRIPDYAASWATLAFLTEHPRYQQAFAEAESGPLDGRFTQRLQATRGFDQQLAVRDFDAFTDDVDYGYDLTAMEVDWSAGRPLEKNVRMFVDPARGWQNTQVKLRMGQQVRFASRGRSQLGRLPGVEVDLESEGNGISIDWYRGRPIGRLLLAQWVMPANNQGRPRFIVLGEGGQGRLEASADGPLFVRINDSPIGRRDNTPGLEIALIPQ